MRAEPPGPRTRGWLLREMVGMQYPGTSGPRIPAALAGGHVGEYLTISEVCEKLRLAEGTVPEMAELAPVQNRSPR